MQDQNDNRPRGIFVILSTALITLVVLSLLPWGDFTNHYLKDFSLLSDLIPQSDKTYITHEQLDPELEKLDDMLAEEEDTTSVLPRQPQAASAEIILPDIPEDFEAPEQDGAVLIEDYTSDGSGLAKIRQGLQNAASKTFRIAVIGDSYIEGDILTKDIRSMLQDQYGGAGVGYMAAQSQVAGFRQSVGHTASGWDATEIRHMKSDDYRILAGQYHTGSAGATFTYKGKAKVPHAGEWTKSTVLFIAPAPGTVTITESDGYTSEHTVEASAAVQAITVNRPTSEFGFTSDINGLTVLGTWLEAPAGIQLDNMSLRGNSGISHRNLNAAVNGQMRQYIDYDLIILEFGINALTSEQNDYSSYGKMMGRVVNAVRASYPGAVIMLMGIGDRGQKQGTEVGSMTTAPAMVRAQREAARATGTLFWDTRSAMGGKNAVIDWHNRGLINSDYIHLNHKGGRELAKIFVKSLNTSISE